MTTKSDSQQSIPIVAVVAILVVAAIPRLWAAVWDQGIFWPDEIFQSLEQAHRFAFGYGLVSWEFQDGARSWLFPGLFGLLWKIAALLGMKSAFALILLAKLVMVALALAGIYLGMRLADRFAGPPAALIAGAIGAAFPASLVLSSRCLTEMASGPLLLLAALLVLDKGRNRQIVAGVAAGFAVFLRYQNGVVFLALLALILVTKRWRDAIWFALAAAVLGLAGGMLDWITWGTPFHSFWTYIDYNLIQGKSALYGTEPFSYYAKILWSSTGLSLVLICVGLVASWWRAPGLLIVAVVFFLIHSLVAHKEFRFMMPVVPLAAALAGIGLGWLITHGPWAKKREAASLHGRGRGKSKKRKGRAPAGRRVEAAAPGVALQGIGWPAVVLATLLTGTMGWRAMNLTFGQIGWHLQTRTKERSVWHNKEEITRLQLEAGAREDLCGLALLGIGEVWTGGYTYLHRDVPMYSVFQENLEKDWFKGANYALAPAKMPMPPNYHEVKIIEELGLFRRDGKCGPPPEGYTRLLPK